MPLLNPVWINRLTQMNVLALSVSLLGGFVVQIGLHEIPCALCYLQRVAMMLCGLGLWHVLWAARRAPLSASALAQGYGFVIVAAVFGASVSVRQILLHIVPPDPGFGTPILGLHLYTWGFIVFACEILSAGLILLTANVTSPATVLPRTPLLRGLWWLFLSVVIGNLLTIFAASGWHWELPPDPVRYELFGSR